MVRLAFVFLRAPCRHANLAHALNLTTETFFVLLLQLFIALSRMFKPLFSPIRRVAPAVRPLLGDIANVRKVWVSRQHTAHTFYGGLALGGALVGEVFGRSCNRGF